MAEIETITIPELANGDLTGESLIPFSVPGGEMKKTTAATVASLFTEPISPAFSNSTNFTI